ncbi:hypothetical protein D3C72_1080810 [compost metagenome]
MNGHAYPFARRLRNRDALAAAGDGFRQFIEAECESGTRRKQGVEKMNGKVAADAAIGEPDFRLHDRPCVAADTSHDIQCAAIIGIGRNGLEQDRETQAHACCDDDGQLGGLRKSLEFRKGAARCCDLLQPVHHASGKQLAPFLRVVSHHEIRGRKRVRPPHRQVRRDHLQVYDRLLRFRTNEIAEGQRRRRCGVAAESDVLDRGMQPFRQARNLPIGNRQS